MAEEAEEKKQPPQRPKSVTLTVKVKLEREKAKELPEIMVYAYDRNGQFLTSVPLPKLEQGEENKESEVQLKLPGHLLGETVRVVLGPPWREETEKLPSWVPIMMSNEGLEREAPSPVALIRRGAYEKRVNLRTGKYTLEMVLYEPDWLKLLLCKCVVRGRLVRRFKMPDGTYKYMGVCGACVQIYEVDRFLKVIMELPDNQLYRLRDDLWKLVEKPKKPVIPEELIPEEVELRHWPPPPPPPELFAAPEPTGSPGPATGMTEARLSASEMVSAEALETAAEVEPLTVRLRDELDPIFVAPTVSQLRKAVIAKVDMVVFLACHLEWLLFHFHMDLIKCVPADSEGRFETTIWYPCFGDKPDLYFKAWQCPAGLIYDPGIPCHVYWNYECGTELTLVVTDPAARVCAEPDPVEPPSDVATWVMPYAIGGIRLDKIKSSGLTDYGSIVNAPFGSPENHRLGFRHGHSSAIPTTGLYYYRWLYRKHTESQWHEFSETVVRHYVEELPAKLPTFPTFKLGPYPVNGMHLYRFKPHNPPAPSDPSGVTYWPTDEWFADIYSGYLDTYDLPGGIYTSAGNYKIKLEVYDSSGNRVSPGAGTFQFIVPDGLASDGKTILTRNANPGEIQNDGFVFNLRIDNRPCTAIIDAPKIGGIGADPQCGMLRYESGDLVKIAFHAQHPAKFATFYFWIVRSSTTLASTVASGEVGAGAAGVYTGDGNGNFQHNFPVSAMLGPCPEAAFAEELRTYAKATNGWRRLWEYDAYATRAFALAPKPPGP